MRTSKDEIVDGKLINGFDYTNQAWVRDGLYVRCGHKGNDCACYGRLHEGESNGSKDEDSANTLRKGSGRETGIYNSRKMLD